MKTSRTLDLEKAKKYCRRLLAIRARTEHEIETRLEKTGYSKFVRSRLIDLFKRERLIDDLEFAKEWIDSRLRSNPRAPRVLKAELEAKGVSGTVIEEAFAEKIDELNERAVASGLIREKIRKIKAASIMELKAKLFRFLVHRGFDPELAEDIISEAVS